MYHFLQAFCSSITGTLATQAMLKGVGVGDVTATAAAATITWLLKGLHSNFFIKDIFCLAEEMGSFWKSLIEY